MAQDPTAALTALAVKLATGQALVLWRNGLLSVEEASEQAEACREVARLFEAAGNEKQAVGFWTLSRMLEKPPPPQG